MPNGATPTTMPTEALSPATPHQPTTTTDTDITATHPTPALTTPATTPLTTPQATMAMDTNPSTNAEDTTDTSQGTTLEDTTMDPDMPPMAVSTRQPTEATHSAHTAHAGTAPESPTDTEAKHGEYIMTAVSVESLDCIGKAHLSLAKIILCDNEICTDFFIQ